jgi:hypothetical protein
MRSVVDRNVVKCGAWLCSTAHTAKQDTPMSLHRSPKWVQCYSKTNGQDTSIHSRWRGHSLPQWSGGKRPKKLGRRPRGVPLHSLQYTAAIQSRLNLQSACTASATYPGYESKSERKAKKVISNITTGQASVCGTRRFSFENSWSRNQWVTRNATEMTVHRKIPTCQPGTKDGSSSLYCHWYIIARSQVLIT